MMSVCHLALCGGSVLSRRMGHGWRPAMPMCIAYGSPRGPRLLQTALSPRAACNTARRLKR